MRACCCFIWFNAQICKESIASIWTVKVRLLDSPDTSHLLWKAKLKLQQRGMAWFGECMIVDTTCSLDDVDIVKAVHLQLSPIFSTNSRFRQSFVLSGLHLRSSAFRSKKSFVTKDLFKESSAIVCDLSRKI